MSLSYSLFHYLLFFSLLLTVCPCLLRFCWHIVSTRLTDRIEELFDLESRYNLAHECYLCIPWLGSEIRCLQIPNQIDWPGHGRLKISVTAGFRFPKIEGVIFCRIRFGFGWHFFSSFNELLICYVSCLSIFSFFFPSVVIALFLYRQFVLVYLRKLMTFLFFSVQIFPIFNKHIWHVLDIIKQRNQGMKHILNEPKINKEQEDNPFILLCKKNLKVFFHVKHWNIADFMDYLSLYNLLKSFCSCLI